jgi:hypothetical protein
MRFTRSSGRAAWAAVLALALAFLSAPVSQARQAPVDSLKFDTNVPVLMVWSVKPDKSKDFLDLWAQIREATTKSTLADVQAFGKTLGPMVRLQPDGPLPGAPVEYMMKIMAPSTTQSYHPVRIVVDLFRRQQLERAQADSMMVVLKDSIVEIQAYARMTGK